MLEYWIWTMFDYYQTTFLLPCVETKRNKNSSDIATLWILLLALVWFSYCFIRIASSQIIILYYVKMSTHKTFSNRIERYLNLYRNDVSRRGDCKPQHTTRWLIAKLFPNLFCDFRKWNAVQTNQMVIRLIDDHRCHIWAPLEAINGKKITFVSHVCDQQACC